MTVTRSLAVDLETEPTTNAGRQFVLRTSARLTKAGKRLLVFYDDSYNPEWETFAEAVVAVEAEAVETFIRRAEAAVRAIPSQGIDTLVPNTGPDVVTRDAVYVALREAAVTPEGAPA